MTLGPIGPPPGSPPAAGTCARCGHRVGSYLVYTDSRAAGPGRPPPEHICYRCHRLETRGHLPQSVDEVHQSARGQAAQFMLYRLGMIFVALCTLAVMRRTGEPAHFFYGLGGVILLYTLSRRVRPRRHAADDAQPSAAEAAWQAAVEDEGPDGSDRPVVPPPARVDAPPHR